MTANVVNNAEVMEALNPGRGGRGLILQFNHDYKAVMADVMLQLADTSESTVDFLGYQDLDETGTAFNYLLNDYLSQSESGLSLLLDIYKFEQQTIPGKLSNLVR